jgi:ribosomal protein L37AE/L43A
MSERKRCPNCLSQMSRTLDGSGKWICLPCGRKWEADDPKLNLPFALGGDWNRLVDVFTRKQP